MAETITLTLHGVLFILSTLFLPHETRMITNLLLIVAAPITYETIKGVLDYLYP